MPKLIWSGLIGGLIFGFFTVWQGPGAAMLVLLLSLVGLLVGAAMWIGWRIFRGDLDPHSVRNLAEELFHDRKR